jgi:hypothetical protein
VIAVPTCAAIATVLVAGCGRLGFETTASRGDDAQDVPADASPFTCPVSNAAPDPLRIVGQTFRFTNFNNQTAPVPDVMVSVRASPSDPPIVQTISDNQGRYVLLVPTGGVSQSWIFQYDNPGYLSSVVVPDVPLDHAALGADNPLWSVGDGPVWTASAQDSVYAAAGLARNSTKGTINIAVRECDGTPIEGAVVTVNPPPEKLTYIDAGGVPTTGISGTGPPYTFGLAFNTQPGLTKISASKAGRVFVDQTVFVVGGTMTIAVVRPLP